MTEEALQDSDQTALPMQKLHYSWQQSAMLNQSIACRVLEQLSITSETMIQSQSDVSQIQLA